MTPDKNQHISNLLSRSVNEIIDTENLRTKLTSGKTLRVKFGMDPTSPNLHIGRMVPLLKLRDFQELGHQIILLVGNATGVIGDTSDKDSERPMLSHETVAENMAQYTAQAGKILDMSKVEVVYNADWLDKLGFKEIGELADAFSVHEFTQRDNIRRRLDAGKRVSLREMMYPLMQGYDSVVLKADVEVGGTDQRFNMLAGRTLQPRFDQVPQDVIMTELILGTDGRKMSSSWGNTINLTDDPRTMFGKVMSIPDELIVPYFIHCTRVPLEEVDNIAQKISDDKINPRDAKIHLAKELVTMLHDADSAQKEEDYFVHTFSKKETPDDMPEITISDGETVIDILVREGLANSKGDARRKIAQGGVKINDDKVTDENLAFTSQYNDQVLKVGKKEWRKIVVG
jgi:tyrosyl-tRNA synthetase